MSGRHASPALRVLPAALLLWSCTLPFSDPPSAPPVPTGRVEGRALLPEPLDSARFSRGRAELVGAGIVAQEASLGESGDFLFTEVAAGTWRVRVAVPGTAGLESATFTLADGASHQVPDLQLAIAADATLAGEVRLEGRSDHGGIAVGCETSATVTGSDGGYTLLCPGDRQSVSFAHPGYTPVTLIVRAESGRETAVDTVVLRGEPGHLRGTVRLPAGVDDRDALTAVDVELREGGSVLRTVHPEPDGRFAFDTVPPGAYDVAAVEAPFLPAVAAGVVVQPGGDAYAGVLQLGAPGEEAPTGRVQGRALVLGGADGAHGGSRVEVEGWPHVTETRSDGGFALDLPARAEGYELRFVRAGFNVERIPVAALAVGQTVELPDVLLQGQPGRVQGVIQLAPPPGSDGEFDPELLFPLAAVRLVRVDDPEVEVQDTALAADGRFAFEGVAAGHYAVSVELRGFIPRGVVADVDPGETVNLGVIVLSAALDGRLIQGTARRQCLAEACDHAGIRVEALRSPYSTVTGSDGRFLLQVNADVYDLRFSLDGYAQEVRQAIDVREAQIADVEDVDLALMPATVAARVLRLDADGEAHAGGGASVTVRTAGGAAAAIGQANDAGEVVLEQVLEQGTYTVEVTLDRHAPLAIPAFVVPGRRADLGQLTLDLLRGALRGQIAQGGAGTVTVVATGDAGDGLLSGLRFSVSTAPPDGAWRLGRLPVGRYQVTAVGPGLRPPAAVAVQVEAGAESAVPLVLAARSHTVSVGPAPYTADPALEVTFQADDDLTFVQLWREGDAVPAYAPLAGPAPLVLPADGPHRVLARLATAAQVDEDAANDLFAYESPTLAADVVLDRAPPEVARPVVGQGTGYTRDRLVDVEAGCADTLAGTDALDLRLTVDGVVAYDGPFRARHAVALPEADGVYAVGATCRDPAGNTGAEQIADVVLDATPPRLGRLLANGGRPATRERLVAVEYAVEDDDSPVVAGVFEDPNVDCARATLALSAAGEAHLALTGEDGPRRLYLCARDAAGNAGGPWETAEVVLDRVAPAAPRVVLAGGGAHARTRAVALRIDGGADLGLVLAGDLEEAGAYPAGERPASITLSDADGTKVITAVLVDDAGNESLPAAAVIELDRVPPEPGAVSLADGAGVVNTRTIAVSIAETAPDRMRLWEVAPDGACDAAATCADAGFGPFSPASTFTLSEGRGEKQVCWQLCDLAGNGTAPAGALITLGTYLARPRPVLAAISPESVRPEELRPTPGEPITLELTVSGQGFAADTQVEVGGFLHDCVCDGDCSECRAADAGDEHPGCATACTVVLDQRILSRAGSYQVRLETPDPVAGGQGDSENVLHFDVVSLTPRIVGLEPRGISAPNGVVAMPALPGQPPARMDLTVFACGLAENFEASVAGRAAARKQCPEPGCEGPPEQCRQVPCPLTTPPGAPGARFDGDTRCRGPVQQALLEVSLDGLRAPPAGHVEVTITNPSPGGGTAVYPLGITSDPVLCWLPCVTDLRAGRPPAPDGGVQVRLRVPAGGGWGALARHGGTAVTVADEAGTPRVRLEGARGPVPPAPFTRGPVTVEDAQGIGGALVVDAARRRGDGALARRELRDVAFGPRDLALADLDGDGAIDVVLADHAAQALVTLLNDGAGGIAAVRVTPVLERPERLYLADFDADGHTDVATIGEGTPFIGIHLGDGSGRFPDHLEIAAPGQPAALAVGDLDGDRLPDLLVSPANAPVAVALLGRGDGTFASLTRGEPPAVEPVFIETAAGRLGIALGDLDGDRLVDAVFVGAAPPYVVVTMGRGDGAFGPPTAVPLGDRPLTGPRLVDVDLDGTLDLVAAQLEYPVVEVFRGRGDGGFWHHEAIAMHPDPVGGNAHADPHREVEVADLDGDGLPDLVHAALPFESAAVEGRDVLSWAPGVAAVTGFGAPTTYPAASRVEVADLDGDGALDLVALSGDALHGYGTPPGAGRTLGGFEEVEVAPPAGAAVVDERLAAADLDLDGVPDLVVRHRQPGVGPGVVSLLYLDGDGYAEAHRESLATVDSQLRDVVLGDIDGDGDPDVLTPGAGGVDVWINPAPARADWQRLQVRPQQAPPASDWPRALLAGDLDGDGDLDLLLVDGSPGLAARRVRVVTNLTGRTFQVGGAIDIGVSTLPVVPADLDGDGDLDLVVSTAQGFQRYRHTGATYEVMGGPVLPELADAANFAVADLDEDGRPDLAAITAQRHRLALVLDAFGANPRRADDPAAERPPGSFGNELLVRDLNGDTHFDALVREAGDNEVQVWFGGAAGFEGPLELQFGTRTYDLALADFDGNGVPDVVATQTDGRVGIHLSPDEQVWSMAVRDPAAEPPWLERGAAVHLPRMRLDHLAIRVRLEGADLGAVRLALRTPEAQTVVLEDGAGRDPRATVWQAHYAARGAGAVPPTYLAGGAVPALRPLLDRWHPAGAWTLVATDPRTGREVAVRDFTLLVRGALVQAR